MMARAAVARRASLPQVGWRVWALGIALIGVVALATHDFVAGQAVPKTFPDRAALALAVGVFMLAGGLLVQWRRATVWAAGALSAYWLLVAVVLMSGRVILRHPLVYGAWSGLAEQLALGAAGLIVFASVARMDAGRSVRLVRLAQLAFGVCAVLFGGAHFFYPQLTAPLIPEWLPPSQMFWAYATGVFHILGGLGILSGIKDRLAAILLTVMYASFTPLVHLPMLLAKPHDPFIWSENALNIALVGAAWVVADSLAGRGRGRPEPHHRRGQ